MSNPADFQSIHSNVIRQGANHLLALIESEIQAHTAAAEKDVADLRATLAAATQDAEDARRREVFLESALENAHSGHDATLAQLRLADENIDRLVGVLAAHGVSCRRDGEVVEYDRMWCGLFDAIKADEECPGPDEDGDVVGLEPPVGDPKRDLPWAQTLLNRRQARCKRWKEKFIEMETERDEQKKTMGLELDELRRQLEWAQKKLRQSPS